jgi:hypothetical protein
MLIDRFLPTFDVTQICETRVEASAAQGGTMLRYEARTVTTDIVACGLFRRYRRVIHFVVAFVMRRALRSIKIEAEGPGGVRRVRAAKAALPAGVGT